MDLIARLRRVVRSLGFDVVRYDPRTHPFARLMRLLEHHGIDLIFDVGANTGQYGEEMRTLGYTGRLVSFEPLSAAFVQLQQRAAADPQWDTFNLALGATKDTATIHVAQNLQSSSLLEMLPAHVHAAPDSAYIAEEKIRVDTLQAMVGAYRRPGERLLVKADTQGFERQVVEGAGDALGDIVGFQLELSLVPLYKDGPLAADMIRLMDNLGFTLMGLEPAYSDGDTGQLLQVDGLFFRT